MYKYGMELEYFVWDKKCMAQVITSIPELRSELTTDEFPVLGEIRTDPYPKVHLVTAEVEWKLHDVLRKLSKTKYTIAELKKFPTVPHKGRNATLISQMVMSKPIWKSLQDVDWSKRASKERNLYGKVKGMNFRKMTAGLHIHFSDMQEYKINGRPNFIGRPLDIPSIVRQLDNEFRAEILASGRQAGWYEMKSHGFEYRSLPNWIDLHAVANFITYHLEY